MFGAELRYYRAKAGLSQEQLGSRVYCSGDLVGKVENGQRVPTREFTVACDAVPELDTRGALMRLWEHGGNTCVEVGTAARTIAVRDSTDPEGPRLAFTRETWQAFTRTIKAAASHP